MVSQNISLNFFFINTDPHNKNDLNCLHYHIPNNENPNTDFILRSHTMEELHEPIISCHSFSYRCFQYFDTRLYYSLPQELRNNNNIDFLKKKLMTFIFSEAYNIIENTINPNFAV